MPNLCLRLFILASIGLLSRTGFGFGLNGTNTTHRLRGRWISEFDIYWEFKPHSFKFHMEFPGSSSINDAGLFHAKLLINDEGHWHAEKHGIFVRYERPVIAGGSAKDRLKARQWIRHTLGKSRHLQIIWHSDVAFDEVNPEGDRLAFVRLIHQ
ncbi:MAG TPA: hypothetical protein VGL56_09680 [Fimbriimonadaceae bacterium]|jgi:hypothetical protein